MSNRILNEMPDVMQQGHFSIRIGGEAVANG